MTMTAEYRDYLYLSVPDSWRDYLLSLGRFRVKGRLRRGQTRILNVARWDAQGRLCLPRAVVGGIRRRIPELRIRDRRLYFHPIDFRWRGDLRPEQYALVQTVIQRGGNGTVVSVTGSGKTVMGLAMVAGLQQPALWITHRKDLAVAVQRASRDVWDLPPAAIGYVGDGQHRIGTHLTIAMIQTLTHRDNHDLYDRIGTLLVDESHHIAAQSYHAVLSPFPGRYRIGLTGTYEREDGLHPLIGALFGAPIVLPDRVLIAAQRILVPTVIPVYTALRTPEGLAWAHLQQARAADRDRNRQLLGLIRAAVQHRRHVLVLVSRVDHAVWLAYQLGANHVAAVAITGAMPVPDRQRWYQEFRQGRCVLVATSLADEGLDLPECDTVVFATPGRSATSIRQRGGRVMRTAVGKGTAIIYDVVDDHVPALAKQWQARQTVYETAGWPIQEGVVTRGVASS